MHSSCDGLQVGQVSALESDSNGYWRPCHCLGHMFKCKWDNSATSGNRSYTATDDPGLVTDATWSHAVRCRCFGGDLAAAHTPRAPSCTSK